MTAAAQTPVASSTFRIVASSQLELWVPATGRPHFPILELYPYSPGTLETCPRAKRLCSAGKHRQFFFDRPPIPPMSVIGAARPLILLGCCPPEVFLDDAKT